MGEPLVSVLVPAFRSEAYIGDCLRSVTAQTFTDFEVIVVDDDSPDSTYEVAVETLRGWPMTTVVRNETNLGNFGNARRVLQLARGELVKFVNHDDLIAPEALARLVGALEAHPAAAMATSPRTPIDASGAPLPVGLLPQPPFATDVLVDGMDAGNDMLCRLANWIGEPTTVLFRRRLLSDTGLYELGGRAPAENPDVVWWLKILTQGPLAVVNDHLSSFRLHSGQVSSTVGRAKLVLAWHDIILGARELGYLGRPDQEIAAWLAFAEAVSASVHTFDAPARREALDITQSVATRLGELCPA